MESEERGLLFYFFASDSEVVLSGARDTINKVIVSALSCVDVYGGLLVTRESGAEIY